MSTKTFNVWIHALTSNYAEAIAGRLIRRNWLVGALGNQLVLQHDDKPASLIAMSVSKSLKEGEELTPSAILNEVRDVLKVLSITFYSVIVTDSSVNSTWALGNISLAEAIKQDETQKKGMN